MFYDITNQIISDGDYCLVPTKYSALALYRVVSLTDTGISIESTMGNATRLINPDDTSVYVVENPNRDTLDCKSKSVDILKKEIRVGDYALIASGHNSMSIGIVRAIGPLVGVDCLGQLELRAARSTMIIGNTDAVALLLSGKVI